MPDDSITRSPRPAELESTLAAELDFSSPDAIAVLQRSREAGRELWVAVELSAGVLSCT